MTFFRYKEDRIPVLLITSLFFLDLYAFFVFKSTILVFCYAVLGLWFKLFIASWNHNHQHCHTFKQRFLNRMLEIVYTFHTGVTTNVWVLHHNLGHHLNFLDQEKDESAWKRKDGTIMGEFEYTVITAATGYYKAAKVGKNYPKYQKDFIAMGLLNLLVLIVLTFINPMNAILIFIIPMSIVYIGTCWTTYHHHAGLDTEDHLHASYNNVHKFYNKLTGNLGFHTAHHMKQALHWSKLPELHKSIEKDIPKELIACKFPGLIGVVERFIQNLRR